MKNEDRFFEDGKVEIYKIAYEGTIRELASQESALSEIRARAGVILGLAASFGAASIGLALASGEMTDLSYPQVLLLALGSVGMVATLLVGFWLLGSVKLRLHSSAQRIIADNWKGPVARVYNDLARHQDTNIVANQVALDRRHQGIHAMALAALIELFAWSALVGLMQ